MTDRRSSPSAAPVPAAVVEVVDALTAAGVHLWVEGTRLRFRSPPGAFLPEHRAFIATQRDAVVQLVRARASARIERAPLSYNQRAQWFIHQENPESAAYHVSWSVRIRATLNQAALDESLQALSDRHATLRTTYALNADDQIEQRVVGALPVHVQHLAAPGATDDELRELAEREHARAFDLANGPVFRATLITRDDAHHVLIITLHHIACDAWSLALLFDDFRALYTQALGSGGEVPPRVERTYTDFVAWQAAFLASEQGRLMGQRWARALAPPRAHIALPGDRPPTARRATHGASVSFTIEPELLASTMRLARAHGTTLVVILLAAYQAMLYRLTGTNDVVVGTPASGRTDAQFGRTVGHFVNPLPIRTRVHSGMSFRSLLNAVSTALLSALDDQDYPFMLMVQQAAVGREANRSPLYDVFFGVLGFDRLVDAAAASAARAHAEFAGIQCEAFPIRQQEGQFKLSLQIVEQGGMLAGSFLYDPDLYDASTIRALGAHYTHLLGSVAMNVDTALEHLTATAEVGPAGMSGDDARRRQALTLLGMLRARDVKISAEAGKLRINAPAGSLEPALKAELAAYKTELLAILSANSTRGAVRQISRDGPLPVSFAQQRLWFLDRMTPGSAHYNITVPVRITGALQVEALTTAIDALPERQEALRLRIHERDGNPVAELGALTASVVTFVDLSAMDAADRAAELNRVEVARASVPFDLSAGPLIRAAIIRLSPIEHMLVVTMHHIASDGWSLNVAVAEIFSVYDSIVSGRAPQLPPLAVQYVDFAAWEREQLHSGVFGGHLAFWQQQLAGAPALLELPTDRPRPAVMSYRGRRTGFSVSPTLLERVKALARAHEATLYMTLLATWQVLLHRYSGQDDIVVGSPLANRDREELEGVIGCFVNNVVMRGNLAGNPTFAEFLSQMKSVVLNAFDHRELPFDRLVEGLRPERSTSHSPIFQALFTLHSFPVTAVKPSGLQLETFELKTGQGTARFDITLEMDEHEGGLRVVWEYATDLFDASTIERMHAQYLQLLAAVCDHAELSIDSLPMLSGDDERALLASLNHASIAHDRTQCVHQLVASMCAERPASIAVQAGEETLTYAELDARSNQMAHLLYARGVRHGALVGICLDRSASLPVALLAVLKCGAAYVPVDPTHPAKRVLYTLEDAGVACVITEARFLDMTAGLGVPVVDVHRDATELAAQRSTAPETRAAPSDLAYVLYTSGSTGRPKGVEVEHRNVVNFLGAMSREPGFSASDVLVAVTTPSFDIAGLEIFLPLITGGTIVIAPRSTVVSADELAALLVRAGATVMQATPATWRLLLDAGWPGKADLRVLCGGEAMPRDLARELLPRVQSLWNMYGPTETTIWSTVHRVTEAHRDIPIGHAIANTTLYVLDAAGRQVPIGVSGELCIGGEGVARGYRNRPELTAQQFVTIALPGDIAERVYRTGDIVRVRSDYELEYVGRRDNQIKLRGYRIELGEIDAQLLQQPGVVRAATIVREDSPSDQRLVAYVVYVNDEGPRSDDVRAALRLRLPEYMVPSAIVALAALPLTPNGKIDRKALPVPALENGAGAAADLLMTEPQRQVARIWQDVLRVPHVRVEDNFFDVGGHSLLVVKVHAALQREFQREFALVDLFQHTTVAAQARLASETTDHDQALLRARSRAARQMAG